MFIVKRAFIFFIFCISVGQSYGQSEQIEKLSQKINTATNDSVRGSAYYELARALNYINPEKALDLVDSGEYYLQLAGDELRSRESMYYRAVVTFAKGDLEKSLNHSINYYNYTDSVDNELRKAYALNILSRNYREVGDYKNAILYLTEGLELNDQLDIKRDVPFYATELGNLYSKLSQFDLAKENFLLAHQVASDIDFKAGIAVTLRNLAENAIQLKDYEGAFKYLEESISIDSIDGRQVGLSRSNKNMAHMYELQGNNQTAYDHYQKALSYLEGLEGVKNDFANLYLSVTRTLLALNKVNQAQEYLSRAEALKDEVNSLEFNSALEKARYSYYEKTNQFEKAYFSMQLFLEDKDSLLNEDISNQVTGSSIKYESDKKAREIEFLNVENENSNLKLEASNRRNWVFGGLLALLSIGSIIFYQLFKKIKNQNSIITNALSDKEILLKEIHHRVKNNLQVVSSLLSLQGRHSNDPNVENAIREGKDRVRSMSIIHQKLYQDDSLTTVNVKDYFDQLFLSLFDSYNIHAKAVNLELDIQIENLDVDTIVPIGLIVNELVSNALKYAFPENKKGQVKISLKERKDVLELIVEDDGIGIDDIESLTKSSFGYQLIESFMDQLNGELSIESQNGTAVIMNIKDYKKAS